MNKGLGKLVIRELKSMDEYKATEQFQRKVWGEDDPADNADLLFAIARSGGLVAAAFDGTTIVGLVFGFPTNSPTVQHSHRLGVIPHLQGSGIGTRLKWFQRDWCLQNGIETVCWTYDPMRRANAILNIALLGAIANEYHENYYGDMAGINAGVPSDRVIARWLLSSQRVICCATGIEYPLASNAEHHYVRIPENFSTLLLHDRELACKERLRVREELKSAFEAGYHIQGFERNSCSYLLCKDAY